MEKKEQNFEQTLTTLEDIVAKLEKGEATLEEAMELYEQGMKLTIALNHKLKDAKLKIEELKKPSDEN